MTSKLVKARSLNVPIATHLWTGRINTESHCPVMTYRQLEHRISDGEIRIGYIITNARNEVYGNVWRITREQGFVEASKTLRKICLLDVVKAAVETTKVNCAAIIL